jgi:hypothetical protein
LIDKVGLRPVPGDFDWSGSAQPAAPSLFGTNPVYLSFLVLQGHIIYTFLIAAKKLHLWFDLSEKLLLG